MDYCQGVTVAEQRVRANGIDFNVAISDGDEGPPVLFLHGFPEGWLTWRPLMEAMPHVPAYAPDLRGYPDSDRPDTGYDVWTLTDDVAALIEELGLDRPVLVGSDWGGELAWIFAHRYSHLIRRMVAINGPHPGTLVRAVRRFEHFQTLTLPWIPIFQPPRFAEWFMTRPFGRKVVRLGITVREGRDGTMNEDLLDQMLARFETPRDMRGPVEWYREMVRTQLQGKSRKRLEQTYATPITVPMTQVWGMKDGALSDKVAMNSHVDAGGEVEWRPLPGVGHFVSLEAPELLTEEIERVLAIERAAA